MGQQQAVIYTARSKQQAHLLRNLLEETGIEAVVTGDVLSDGTGVDAVGWATAARVVVAQRDAETARQMAEEFDRQVGAGEAMAAADLPPGDSGEVLEWPVCPECDARRTATCPICRTSGTDFSQADPDFVGSLEPDTQGTAMSCGCGSGGCSTKQHDACEVPGPGQAAGEAAAGEADAGEADAGEVDAPKPGLVLMCSICDEPFKPEFPRRCAWCGHEFPDGYDVDIEEGPPPEDITARALVVIIALGLLAIGLLSYFMFLVPNE